jgi:hypothetical protein
MAKFLLSAFADEASSNLEEQIQALKENPMAFVDPAEWTAFHKDLERRFLIMCAEEAEQE